MSDERVNERYDDEEFEAHKLTTDRAGDGDPERVVDRVVDRVADKVDDDDFEGHQLRVTDRVTDKVVDKTSDI